MKFITCSILFLAFQISFSQTKPEAQMGENQHKLLELTYGFYENPELLSFIEEIGHNLEKELNLDYKLQYYLLDIEEPNAFATTGGYVYVTRGLLALINTKDELAGILGHELSHVILKHGSKKSYGNILPSILKLPGNIIGLITIPEIGNIINLPIEFTSEAALSGFSRDMESNADKLGVEIATKAGYYPYGLGDALVRLNDYSEYLVNREIEKSIFNDHPMTAKRVQKLIAINEKQGFKRRAIEPGTTIKELDQLIYGQNPKGGIIKDSTFIHPSLEFYCEFPPKWSLNNSPESISALSDDKKSLIIISVEKESNIESALEKELKKYKSSSIIEKQKIIVNGLNGYQLTLKVSAAKQADKFLKIMWVDIPKSPTPIKIQAIAKVADFPNNLINESFETFRNINQTDYSKFEYSIVSLKKPDYKINSYEKLLRILNNLNSKDDIPDNRFIKEIKSMPLEKIN